MRVRLTLIERNDGLDSDSGIRAAVHAHSGELYGFAFRSLGDQGLAEETVQDTFVRAWRAGRRFDPNIASLRAWLFAILRNVIIDAHRARSVRADVGVAVDIAISDNIDLLFRSWLIEEALRRLTDEHRHAVVEVYYEQRAAVDVAAALGVPAATIRSRLFYGLKAMRLSLDELGWDDA